MFIVLSKLTFKQVLSPDHDYSGHQDYREATNFVVISKGPKKRTSSKISTTAKEYSWFNYRDGIVEREVRKFVIYFLYILLPLLMDHTNTSTMCKLEILQRSLAAYQNAQSQTFTGK